MLTGKPNPDYLKLSLDFGTYVHVFEDNNPTNSTLPRSTGAIALNTTGNKNGDYYILSFKTGRRLSRRQWKIIPVTSEVINAFEYLVQLEGQRHVSEGSPIFEWNPNIIIDYNEHDSNEEPEYIEDGMYHRGNIDH
jgi:hypothetical protein